MKLGLIGKSSHVVETLGKILDVETIDYEGDINFEAYKVILLNPDGFKEIPKLDIPNDCQYYNLFSIDNSNPEVFTSIQENSPQMNFIVEYPGMRTDFLLKTVESASQGMAFQPLMVSRPETYHNFNVIKSLLKKGDWLQDFKADLKDRILFNADQFFDMVGNIVGELVLNSYIHGYGVDPNDIHSKSTGKVVIRWGLDDSSLVIKVTDFCGNLDFIKFLNGQCTARDVDSVRAGKTSGLGILMAVNFADHLEIISSPGVRTEARIYFNLARKMFERTNPKRASMVLLERPMTLGEDE